MDSQPAPSFVSTSIPYVNGRPHIGHAMEYVIADALARAHRLFGEDVWFQTGTDDNSLKNVQAAERERLPIRTLVDRNADTFRALADQLGVSYDGFIRTSADPGHVAGVHKLWQACAAQGDIYRDTYRGLYCVGCEQFYTEAELEDGLCPEHRTPPEVIEEDNYFFRLSRYAETLAQLIASDQMRVWPAGRKNEVLSFIRGGLADLSVSRSQARAHGWGIPVPGDSDQVIYVWFDALANYITALDYADDGPRYQRYWAGNPHRVHVIGKGILRFHAVYWPAFLLSAGAPLPTTIMVHGYLTVEAQKIGKSLGNAIDPLELVQAYGPDALRYYLLRHTPAAEDSDFSRTRLKLAYNNELADQLGNLLSRTVSMVVKYSDGVVPAAGSLDGASQRLAATGAALRARVRDAVERLALHEALAAIWELIGAANKYVVDMAPWTLAKARATGDDAAGERLATALYTLIEVLRLAAVYCEPFMPDAAARIATQLGLAEEWRSGFPGWGGYTAGACVRPGPALFPKK